MATQESTLRIPVATFLHGLIVMAGAFGAYYVSSEISPLRGDISDMKVWKIDIDKRAVKCESTLQVFKNEHGNMMSTINRHHETDLITIQGLQAQINDLRNKE